MRVLKHMPPECPPFLDFRPGGVRNPFHKGLLAVIREQQAIKKPAGAGFFHAISKSENQAQCIQDAIVNSAR